MGAGPSKKAGVYRLSLYFFNKDGHTIYDRPRDWLVEVYPLPQSYWSALARPVLSAMRFPNNRAALQWAGRAMAATPLAQTRVVNFWNPVYARFALAGPGQYMVRIVRGSSINTEICGVFLDKADMALRSNDQRTTRGAAGSAVRNPPLHCMWGVQYSLPPMPIGLTGNASGITAGSIFHQARHAFGSLGFNARWEARLLAYRVAAANSAPPELLARWRWRLDIWTPHDRELFDTKMNQAFRARLKQWKGLKKFMIQNHELQGNSGKLGKGEPGNE